MKNKKILWGAITLVPLLAPFAFVSCACNKKEKKETKETEDQKLKKEIETKVTNLKAKSELLKELGNFQNTFNEKLDEILGSIKDLNDLDLLRSILVGLDLVSKFFNDENLKVVAENFKNITTIYNSVKNGKLPHEAKIKADYEKLQELLTKDFFTNQNEIATILASLQKVLDKTIYGWTNGKQIINIKFAVNGLLNPTKLDTIFGATGLNKRDEVQGELEAILPKLDALLSKEFDKKDDFANSEVQTLGKEVATLFAKYFRDITTKDFSADLLKTTEKEFNNAKNAFAAGNKFVMFTTAVKSHPFQFWRSEYTLIDYSRTLLRDYMSSAYNIINVATKEENKGKKFDHGATLTNADESKLTLEFVLVNKILWDESTDDHTTSVINGYDNFKFEITKK